VTAHDLAHVNAALNGLSTVLLALGYFHIKKGNQGAHEKCMVAAFISSSVFLVFYLLKMVLVGYKAFPGDHWFKPYYLAILFPHVTLAALMVPFILMALWYAWKGRFEKHRKIARWAWPVWMFVSVTGVIVYYLLNHYAKAPMA